MRKSISLLPNDSQLDGTELTTKGYLVTFHQKIKNLVLLCTLENGHAVRNIYQVTHSHYLVKFPIKNHL